MDIYVIAAIVLVLLIIYYAYRKYKEKKKMGAGLEIYNGNGNKTFSSDDLTYRILGEFSTGTADGSITDANIGNQRVWITVVNAETTGSGQYQTCPLLTISGNTISWVFKDPRSGFTASRVSYSIAYGVY